jgi:hypothetical protein
VEWDNFTPIEEQIKTLSNTGVFVFVHGMNSYCAFIKHSYLVLCSLIGAAGANIPFLPAHAAVIEIFPYNCTNSVINDSV